LKGLDPAAKEGLKMKLPLDSDYTGFIERPRGINFKRDEKMRESGTMNV
jgi:hypothetical protein